MALSKKDIVRLPINKRDVLWALEKAQQTFFIDNLRKRHPNVKFDSITRGVIGEIAFEKWLRLFGIEPKEKNAFDTQHQLDIDFLLAVENRTLTCELKTSLVPDKDQNIAKSLQHRDIKLIKRKDQNIEQLHGDLHVQLFFNQLAKAKDKWLMSRKVNLSTTDLEELYYQLAAYRYLRDVYFVGWIDKEKLIEWHTPSEETWSFKNAQRIFYRCNLQERALPPKELIRFLKSDS